MANVAKVSAFATVEQTGAPLGRGEEGGGTTGCGFSVLWVASALHRTFSSRFRCPTRISLWRDLQRPAGPGVGRLTRRQWQIWQQG